MLSIARIIEEDAAMAMEEFVYCEHCEEGGFGEPDCDCAAIIARYGDLVCSGCEMEYFLLGDFWTPSACTECSPAFRADIQKIVKKWSAVEETDDWHPSERAPWDGFT